jgi:hypothetical protein
MTYLIKHILQLVLRKGTAFHVLNGTELLSHALSILSPHWRHLLLGQLVFNAGVIPQIHLRAYDEAGNTGAVVVDLGKPLLANVLEGGGGGDAEADEEDVGLRIGEGAQSIVIFLTSGIEEAKCIRFVTNPGMKCQLRGFAHHQTYCH